MLGSACAVICALNLDYKLFPSLSENNLIFVKQMIMHFVMSCFFCLLSIRRSLVQIIMLFEASRYSAAYSFRHFIASLIRTSEEQVIERIVLLELGIEQQQNRKHLCVRPCRQWDDKPSMLCKLLRIEF